MDPAYRLWREGTDFRLEDAAGVPLLVARMARARYLRAATLVDRDGADVGRIERRGTRIALDVGGTPRAAIVVPRLTSALRTRGFVLEDGARRPWLELVPPSGLSRRAGAARALEALMDSDLLLVDGDRVLGSTRRPEPAPRRLSGLLAPIRAALRGGPAPRGQLALAPGAPVDAPLAMLLLLFRTLDYAAMRSLD
ncbi:hypothetical protein [Sphingomicrobium astaxanthinifaciens]|uniref:hypothetical protein n=1 Tax=Sphingomicrobium astaxanthinifaciens TaxID=1227949 RepID=UPI001FCC5F2D|nr:hypothetical protein [Sphingomicrobium astaxanthinifaciens]MCJ7422088.1 hypothetical protein [Sphingomicrobium astaxanthinifaciens]